MADWLDLNDTKDWINYTKLTGQDDLSLQRICRQAAGEVERLCGPVPDTAIADELVRAGHGCDRLPLRFRPRELTAVKLYATGAALTLADFDADTSAWCVECGAAHAPGQLLWRKDGGLLSSDLLVSYSTGVDVDAAPPDWAVLAALDIVRQLWRTRLRPAQGAPEGFLVSKQALEHMSGHLLAPDGFA